MVEAQKNTNFIRMFKLIDSYIDLFLNTHFQKFNLTGSQHVIVTVACRNPGITQKSFNDLFSIHRSNITRNLVALEKQGYITRKKDENDSRSWVIYPTEKAQKDYDEIAAVFDMAQKELLQDFSEEEQVQLMEFLQKILERFMQEP